MKEEKDQKIGDEKFLSRVTQPYPIRIANLDSPLIISQDNYPDPKNNILKYH